MIARRLVVVVAALLLTVQVVRNAAVDALADVQPQAAAKAWATHPNVEISLGLVRIATTMRDRQQVGRPVFDLINDGARKAPLSPQPYLVRGVQAQVAGDMATAERAFEAAQHREPRSIAAAYFLADHYFRSGDAVRGLDQVVILSRLSPGGIQSVAPYVAASAQNRAAWPHLRRIFRAEPKIEDASLAILARDAANLDAVLALSDPARRSARSEWLSPLVAALIRGGQYVRARTLWASVSRARVTSGELLFDSSFSNPEPPAPFNWDLASSTVGLAERQPGRRLHVMYYGQEDGVLARQLLVLPAGAYRMVLRVAGSAKSLSWSVRCANAQGELSRIALDAAGARGWSFQVPANCPAQWLELSGASSDMPQQSDVTISALQLKREGAHG